MIVVIDFCESQAQDFKLSCQFVYLIWIENRDVQMRFLLCSIKLYMVFLQYICQLTFSAKSDDPGCASNAIHADTNYCKLL